MSLNDATVGTSPPWQTVELSVVITSGYMKCVLAAPTSALYYILAYTPAQGGEIGRTQWLLRALWKRCKATTKVTFAEHGAAI